MTKREHQSWGQGSMLARNNTTPARNDSVRMTRVSRTNDHITLLGSSWPLKKEVKAKNAVHQRLQCTDQTALTVHIT